ncbi:MAG: adenosylcobinamide-GDP ribazoletransferase [Pseudomonadota bacterium]
MTPQDRDQSPMKRLWDIPAAFVLLTRLPLPALPDHAFAHGARAVWAYPLVGLGLGLVVATLSWLSNSAGLTDSATAGLMLAALILLTGAMHEDGLADTADGLWGGHDRDRRLEIMKDSRIGAYGVLALIVTMGLRWLGLADATPAILITALMLSRAAMPVLMLTLPLARANGLSHSVGAPSFGTVVSGGLIAAVFAVFLCGGAGLLACLVVGGITLGMGWLAQVKIDGQTGDILGGTQILCEVGVLLTLNTLLA